MAFHLKHPNLNQNLHAHIAHRCTHSVSPHCYASLGCTLPIPWQATQRPMSTWPQVLPTCGPETHDNQLSSCDCRIQLASQGTVPLLCHCALNTFVKFLRTEKTYSSQPPARTGSTPDQDINQQCLEQRSPSVQGSEKGEGLRTCLLVLFFSRSFSAHLVRDSHKDAKTKIFTLKPNSRLFNSKFTELEPLLSSARHAR